MKIKNITRYYDTIIRLNFYQIFYRIIKSIKINKYKKKEFHGVLRKINQSSFSSNILYKNKSLYSTPNKFHFINETCEIDSYLKISNKKKLWRYNLYYFDYLNHFSNLDDASIDFTKYINLWINEIDKGEALEPYPTSLRIVNWIKWSIRNKYYKKNFVDSLYSQSIFLKRNIEYDIMGNHIIANSKALIFAGIYFMDNDRFNFLKKGKEVLYKNIDKQVLNDGGHYERSPMYHSIVLEDFIDIYTLLNDIDQNENKNLLKLKNKILEMLIWIEKMTHKDGKISFFNDTSLNLCSDFNTLKNYAEKVGIRFKPKNNISYFKDTGYFVFTNEEVDFKFSAGSVKPKEQPGHAHADTLSFELAIGNFKTFVNTGTSTYENNKLRSYQRSTKAHNTLEIDNTNSSDVWSSFRVGKRAKVKNFNYFIKENFTEVEALHDGYQKYLNITHKRNIKIFNNKIIILDSVNQFGANQKIRFYINPEISATEMPLELKTLDGYFIRINCKNGCVKLLNSTWYPEFGVGIPNKCIEVTMKDINCETVINWKKG